MASSDAQRRRFRRPLSLLIIAYKAILGLSEIIVGVLLIVPGFDPQATFARLSAEASRLLERRPCLGQNAPMASYSVNERAVAHARQLIKSRQYVLASEWGEVQPRAEDQNAFLASHSWEEYAEWHLGLTEGAEDETKARYAFVFGDFRRIHRSGVIACHYRAAE